jgi:hypothetical protein
LQPNRQKKLLHWNRLRARRKERRPKLKRWLRPSLKARWLKKAHEKTTYLMN